MKSVVHRVMRVVSLLALSAFALCVASCDTATSPRRAGIGSNTSAGSSLAISPNDVSLRVGSTVQLSTNQSSTSSTNVEWNSLESLVAAVSPSGLVTALSAGSTTIVARLASDTTVTATATITVTP